MALRKRCDPLEEAQDNLVEATGSGVARVPCALGQEIFLCPPSAKHTEYELKISCKRAEEAKVEPLL